MSTSSFSVTTPPPDVSLSSGAAVGGGGQRSSEVVSLSTPNEVAAERARGCLLFEGVIGGKWFQKGFGVFGLACGCAGSGKDGEKNAKVGKSSRELHDIVVYPKDQRNFVVPASSCPSNALFFL